MLTDAQRARLRLAVKRPTTQQGLLMNNPVLGPMQWRVSRHRHRSRHARRFPLRNSGNRRSDRYVRHNRKFSSQKLAASDGVNASLACLRYRYSDLSICRVAERDAVGVHARLFKMSEFELERTLDELYECARQSALDHQRPVEGSSFAQSVAAIERKHGVRSRVDLLRKTLARLLKEHEAQIDGLDYPESVRAFIREEFQRIGDHVHHAEDGYFDLQNGPARRDFRLACFSRIPVGVEDIEPSGIPRSLGVRGGVAQGLRFLRMLRQTGGVKPVYEDHVSGRVRSTPLGFFRDYNPETRVQAYRNIAACLERNPSYRALLSGSWWFDPQLAEISPGLAKMGEIMLQNGAFLFRYKTDSDALRHALQNSPARQRLYEQGKYTPVTYFIVWPRDALIAWAKKTS